LRTAARALLFVVLVRFVVHALYVPAYEGPDEPFHLAHATGLGWPALPVDGTIVASVVAHPCSADLRRALRCPPFGSAPAEWNVLRFDATPPAAATIPNYERHQPPAYYVIPSLLPIANPIARLLAMRLFSVALIFIALLFPLRAVARSRGDEWYAALLLVLLIPGAAESLARCANDSAVFLWTAVVVSALDRRIATPWLALLAAVGPLIKLTALPIVVLLIFWTLMNRTRIQAFVVACASALVLPLQWLRGFHWGGTVELNAARAPFDETLMQIVKGLARSGYTFAKTGFWLGEWSVFRAPSWLLIAAALLAVIAIFSMRIRRPPQWQPNAVALLVAIAATLAWFVSHRLFWGNWGGVGGWYAWGWLPWLAVVAHDFVQIEPPRRRTLFVAGVVLIVIANVAWFAAAHAVYRQL
jgi:hypothetical protein